MISKQQSGYQKDWYKRNKQKHIRNVATNRKLKAAKNRKKAAEYLSQHPCVDCGESDIVVLQFDHVRGKKTANVSDMVHMGSSWSTIEKEIQKCDVRCANDHARRHFKK